MHLDGLLRMNRSRSKIALMVSACLLVMDFAAGAAIAIEPCPPSICCAAPIPMHMDMESCNNMLNFAHSIQKCCDGCNDLFCGLLNDPLKDVKTVYPSPEMGYYQSFHAVSIQSVDLASEQTLVPKPWHLISFEETSNSVPLYIEHLSLII